MDNVVVFPGSHPFVLDEEREMNLDSERVLNGALEADLTDVIVMGRSIDTDEFYLATTTNSVSKIVYLLELAKKRAMEIGD